MGRQINQSLACCAMLCRQDTVSDLRWQHRNRITPGIESRLQCNARHPPAEIYGRKSRTVSELLLPEEYIKMFLSHLREDRITRGKAQCLLAVGVPLPHADRHSVCAGKRVSQQRLSECHEVLSANVSNRQKYIWILQTCLRGRLLLWSSVWHSKRFSLPL